MVRRTLPRPLAAAASLALLATACGSSAPSAPTVSGTSHAEVTDTAGDGIASIGVPTAPDLVRGIVDVNGGAIALTMQFAPGTLDRQTTRLSIELDTDQNPSTGITGASGLGIDYVLDLWAARATPALVEQAMPAACAAGGQCYAQSATASFTIGPDTMTTTVPLAMLGNSNGRLNYRVFAYASSQPATPTITADIMPDISLPPAHVP